MLWFSSGAILAHVRAGTPPPEAAAPSQPPMRPRPLPSDAEVALPPSGVQVVDGASGMMLRCVRPGEPLNAAHTRTCAAKLFAHSHHPPLALLTILLAATSSSLQSDLLLR